MRLVRVPLSVACTLPLPSYGARHRPRSITRKPKWRAMESETEKDLGNVFDIEEEAEKFMQRQAELESGDTSVPVLKEAVGTDVVPDDVAKGYCREIVEVVRDLDKFREMTLNEVKLTVAIDARDREQKEGPLEIESDVTRSELVRVLTEVINGEIPNDRIALKVLWEEMLDWPMLEEDRTKAKKGDTEASAKESGWRKGQARPPIGRDASEKPASLEDILPDWVGYSYLYILSAVPLMIGITVVAILFVNSLQ